MNLTESAELYTVRGIDVRATTGVVRGIIVYRYVLDSLDARKVDNVVTDTLEQIEVNLSVHSESNDLILVGKLSFLCGDIYGSVLEEHYVLVAEVGVSRDDLKH